MTAIRRDGAKAAAMAVPLAVCLCMLAVGCARKPAATGAPGARPALSQAEIDKIIPPLSQEQVAQMSEGAPTLPANGDRMRAVYAGLPSAARQQVASTGEYAFHIGDLPPEHAQVIKDVLTRDDGIRLTVEDKVGNPPDLSNITVLFQHQGDYVALRFRFPNGNEGNWAPFGMWAGGK